MKALYVFKSSLTRTSYFGNDPYVVFAHEPVLDQRLVEVPDAIFDNVALRTSFYFSELCRRDFS